jgi:hypothetical protein
MAACPEGDTRNMLAKKLMDTELKYNLLIETTRKRKK